MKETTDILINTEEKKQHILDILETVYDPEVPVLSVIDMGIIRNVEIVNDSIEVTINILGLPGNGCYQNEYSTCIIGTWL